MKDDSLTNPQTSRSCCTGVAKALNHVSHLVQRHRVEIFCELASVVDVYQFYVANEADFREF